MGGDGGDGHGWDRRSGYGGDERYLDHREGEWNDRDAAPGAYYDDQNYDYHHQDSRDYYQPSHSLHHGDDQCPHDNSYGGEYANPQSVQSPSGYDHYQEPHYATHPEDSYQHATYQDAAYHDPRSAYHDPHAAYQDPHLPYGWTAHRDPESQHYYYYNATSQERTWTHPGDSAPSAPTTASTESALLDSILNPSSKLPSEKRRPQRDSTDAKPRVSKAATQDALLEKERKRQAEIARLAEFYI
jgi:hypothetical protein